MEDVGPRRGGGTANFKKKRAFREFFIRIDEVRRRKASPSMEKK